jgi:hypothetical protein
MNFRRDDVFMGGLSSIPEFSILETDPELGIFSKGTLVSRPALSSTEGGFSDPPLNNRTGNCIFSGKVAQATRLCYFISVSF